eukprot:m.1025619 g.1025619  ORF g.1025619 m.1025619 type:complete len:313 (+) comp24105_c0_seq14:917-1855(+)
MRGNRIVTKFLGATLFATRRASAHSKVAVPASAVKPPPPHPPSPAVSHAAALPVGPRCTLPAQEMGATLSLTASFRKMRQETAHMLQLERSRLVVRCGKLATMYRSASAVELLYKRSALEQNAAPWQAHEYATGHCDNCGGTLVTTRGVAKDHCRICGRVMCTACLVVVPQQSLGRPPPTPPDGSAAAAPVEVPYDVGGSGVVVCTGQCLSVAVPVGSSADPRTVQRFLALYHTLWELMSEMPDVVCAVSRTPGMVDNTALRRWQFLRDKSDTTVAAMAKLPLVSPGYRFLISKIRTAYTALLRSMLEQLRL